jgi:hypothetical protein
MVRRGRTSRSLSGWCICLYKGCCHSVFNLLNQSYKDQFYWSDKLGSLNFYPIRQKMKSPLYLLTILLPLATELAAASPSANPDVDSFDEIEERDLEDRQGGGRNRCRIERPYSYWKYPCDSSDRTGRANRGDQFSATCKYRQVKLQSSFT